MSSMLKKGAGAFKPKAPIARRRPAPAVTALAPVEDSAAAAESPTETASASQSIADAIRDSADPSESVEPSLEPPNQPTPPNTLPEASITSTAPSEPPTTTESARRTRSPGARRVTAATRDPVVAEPEVSATPSTVSDASHLDPSSQPATNTPTLSRQLENNPARTKDLIEPPSPPGTQEAEAPTPTLTRTTETSTSLETGPSVIKPVRSTPVQKPKLVTELTAPSSIPAPDNPSTSSATAPVAPSVDNGQGSSTKSTTTSTAKKPSARQPRKRKAPAATAESEADTGTETVGPIKKKRAPRKNKPAANGEESLNQASSAEKGGAVAPKKRLQRKKKTAVSAGNDESGNGRKEGPRIENEGEDTERTRKGRRKRNLTPEDAEQQTVDHEQMVMSELTRDLKIGAKFSKYDELRERIRKKRAQQRLIKLGKLQPGEEIPDENGSESGTPGPDAPKKPAPPPQLPQPVVDEGPVDSVPQLEIVDGHIRINEASMQYDRHAAADQARGVVLEQEEDDFTTPVTQRTYMRRQPQGNFWTDTETIKFYHGLRMFGTDFNMISKMFGGAKNRRQVKLKFNREERANPVAVNRCIIGEKDVPMDLEAVDGADELEDSKAITDELARLKEEQEAETRRQEEEEAATNRRKKDELFGKRKGDKVPWDHDDEPSGPRGSGPGRGGNQAKEAGLHAGAQYGVGTDPDIIDETDLPSAASARGRARGAGRGRRGGRGAIFAGGIGG